MDYIEDDEPIKPGKFRQNGLDETLEFVYNAISQFQQNHLM